MVDKLISNDVGEGLRGGFVFQKPSHDDVSSNNFISYLLCFEKPIFDCCFHGLIYGVCSVVAYAWGNMERKRE